MVQRQHFASSPSTILIIENDASNRFLVEKIVSISGYHYLSASNGKDALELLTYQHVDIVLTDLSMPDLDGYDVIRLIRQLPAHRVTPIIALTAFSFYDEQQRALAMGCSEIVTKPYRPRELLDIIARHLQMPFDNGASQQDVHHISAQV